MSEQSDRPEADGFDQKHPVDNDSLLESLYQIARFHHCPVTRESLVDGLPLHGGELSPELVPRAASNAGLSARIARVKINRINAGLLPVILMLKDHRSCLLLSVSEDGRRAQVVYPELSETPVEVTVDALREVYLGRAIYVQPEFRVETNSELAGKSTSEHWFWGVIKKNRRLYLDVLLAAVLVNLFAVAMPLFVMNVYDRVVPNQIMETLWVLAVGVLAVLLADFLLRNLRTWFVDRAAVRADTTLSARIMARVLGTRLEYKSRSSGSFAAVLQAFESVRGFIGSAVVVALVDLPFALLFIGIIALIAPELAIPVIIGALVLISFGLIVQRRLQRIAQQSMQASAHRNATLVESLVGLEALKSFRAEGRVQRTWEQASGYLAKSSARSRQWSALVNHFATWAQHSVAVAVVVTGVYLLADGQLSQGGLIAAYLLSSRAMAPISQAAGLLAQYHQAATSLDILEGVMSRPQERPADTRWVSRPDIAGNIEFKHVSFHYPGDEIPVLRDVSFKVAAGERVGILGRNGSGKSSLFRLLMGLYQPVSGSVLVDGVDLRQCDPAEWRRHVGFVPQDVTLFSGTVRDNVTMAMPDAEDEQILAAARLSGLQQVVDTSPRGFDLPVGERGELLSGGQRQSVGLARALIRQPKILLLDEPTASMDHSSEEEVKRNLQSYSSGKTLFVVTHRTSLLELVDRIIVIDAGVIVADGPKQDVIDALRSGRIGKAS